MTKSPLPKTESPKARQAYHDFYALGVQRTLTGLAKIYSQQSPEERPTKQLSTLNRWSTAFSWRARVAQQDAEIARAQFEEIKARSIDAGFAHWPARVQALIELGDMLLEEIYEDDKRWVPDVKAVGAGPDMEIHDIVRFNSPLIEQFRKTMDDIAAELGERRKGIEITGKDGGPIETRDMDKVRKERWAEFSEAISVGVDTEVNEP